MVGLHWNMTALANNTEIKVKTGTDLQDEIALVQRTFTNDRRHLPLTETTGNGSTVSFAYDDFGRITSRTVDNDPDKVVPAIRAIVPMRRQT